MVSSVAPRRPLARDFAATSFQDVTIPLFLLARANMERGLGPLIQDRTFRDCTIEGPAVLMSVDSCSFDDCNYGNASGDIRNLILRPEGERVTGAIPLARCTFTECHFLAIGFTGHDSFLQSLLQTTVRGAQS